MNEYEKNTNGYPAREDNEAIPVKIRRPAAQAAPAREGGASRVPQQRPVPPTAQRPAQNPQRPASAAQRPAGVPAARVQRPAVPATPSAAQRPAAQAAQRPAAPRTPQQGATVASPRPTAPKAAPAPKDPPPYQSRRVMPVSEEAASGKMNPIAPVEKAKKEDKKPESKKSANTKAGADLMISIVKAIAYMAVILVVSVFISIFVIRVGNDVFAFVKSDEVVEIDIPENTNVEELADILYDNGIINFPTIFEFYASLKDDDGKFIAGTYEVSPAMSYDDLRYAFKEQVVTGTTWITIPEGSSVDEIIDIMVENGIGTREKYIEAVNNLDLYDYWFIDELKNNPPKEGRAYMLEGYLFPDTYEFYNASTEEMVVNKLLRRFNEVFVEDYRTRAKDMGYTVDEILIIASLIEKEAGSAADYMYVSSVFHNRLKNPTYYPRLESDATTVYAIQIATGVRPDKVTPEDNQFQSPYNSYLNDGLIPGAITNPGASAIRYALYPKETNYYYFITDNYGKAYYSSSKAEHDNYIAYVKKINEQMTEG